MLLFISSWSFSIKKVLWSLLVWMNLAFLFLTGIGYFIPLSIETCCVATALKNFIAPFQLWCTEEASNEQW